MKSSFRVESRPHLALAWLGLLSLGLTGSLYSQAPDSFESGVNAGGQIYSLAVQPDGKILVGGQIYNVEGQPRTAITRLRADGTLDPDFHGGAASYGLGNTFVDSVIVQPDGKILTHGVAFTPSGETRTSLSRLNADGTLDSTFSPAAGVDGLSFGPLLGIQADGKILVAATVTVAGGQGTNFLARLNHDGSLDPGFSQPALGPGPYAGVSSVALAEDGGILVGGEFFTVGGSGRTNIARLKADGSLDDTFVSPTFDRAAPWLSTRVDIVAVQSDGLILVGGSFSMLNGVARMRFGRLNPDGTVDDTFAPQIGSELGVSSASTVVLQTDGKIWLGGYFGSMVVGDHFGLGRLNPDGSPDGTFDTSISGEWIYALAVQPDGKVLVGGDVYLQGALVQTDVGRLSKNDSATQDLTFDGSTITWLRGGASPEVWRTGFECSTNGADWLSLGAGRRIVGGWQCGPVVCPPTAAIRARGFIQSGERNRSGWFAETIIGRPGITTQPVSRTNDAGTTAGFSVLAGGTGPLSYQWLKDGAPLVGNANISGLTNPVLTLSNVIAWDAGNYSVVVSNAEGTVMSVVAVLTVLDPAINVQPVSQLAQAGLPATLSVSAGGTPALGYQWRKDGIALAGETNSTLTLPDLTWADRGNYLVAVSNMFGSVTSAVAVLTVNMAPPDDFHRTNVVGAVTTLALQPDGKILVANQWSEVSDPSRYYLARVNADGTADETFNASLDPDNAAVNALAVQADGKVMVGGWFSDLGGGAATNLARLNADGSLDPSFQPGADYVVNCLITLPDGKTMVGGAFTNLGGLLCTNLGRLNPNGTLDPSFQSHADGSGNSLLAVQTDGKVLVAAQFLGSNGWSFYRLERLRLDGTLDPTFTNPEAHRSNSYTGELVLSLQPDGKLLVAGAFDSLAGVACTNVGRLLPDGTFDFGFVNPHPAWSFGEPGGIGAFAVQTDGKVFASGYFLQLAGQERSYLARLEADSSLDETFNPDPNSPALCIAVQPDGKIVAGGSFWAIGGLDVSALARLNNTDPAIESLISDGSTVIWLRMGSSPEIWSAVFESSLDATNWQSRGEGVRIAGGWQLSGLALPTGATIRARGMVAASHSSWFVESRAMVGPRPRPLILLDPASFGVRSNHFGFAFSGNLREAAVVESSSDLVNWTSLATNVLSADPCHFSEDASATGPARCYRVRLWP